MKFLTFSSLGCFISLSSFSFFVSASELCGKLEEVEKLTSDTTHKVIIVGETHGTVEMPAMFADLTCHFLKSGRRVLVGLEDNKNSSGAYETYIESSGDDLARKDFLEGAGWELRNSRSPDGRTSQAMLAMLDQFRALKSEFGKLSVTTFVDYEFESDGTQAPYEKAMAASVASLQSDSGADVMLILVGGLHALKSTEDLPYSVNFVPMAMHLPPETVLSLKVKHKGGTTWACIRDGCKEQVVFPDGSKSDVETVVLYNKIIEGFDGAIEIGKITASPPAK